MNGKKLHREFAISRGLDCVSFVKIEDDYYDIFHMYYKDSNGAEKKFTFVYKEMVHWLIQKGSNKVFDHIKLGDKVKKEKKND